MKSNSATSRFWGLDLLRAIAVLAVVLYHYPKDPSQLWLRALSHYGWVGVDLFFVLSGYLIAGQFFTHSQARRPGLFSRFFIRRIFRTLPNYLVVLAIYVIFINQQNVGLWKYFFFIQNFEIPQVFSYSWSLCIEEQFYLVFPVLFLAGSKLFSKIRKRDPRVLAAIFIILGAAVRFFVWQKTRPDLAYAANVDHGFEVYLSRLFYPTYVRLDGLCVGVTLAALRVYHPKVWLGWLGRANFVLGIGVAVLAFAFAVLHWRMSAIGIVLGYPLLALGFGALLISSLGKNSLLCRWKIPGVSLIALLSYSIYLTHGLALLAVSRMALRLGVSDTGLAAAGMSIMSVFVCAAILYFMVERPFMR
ncbi:MAG: acyltransferase family protein, partial [Bdellovibrionota bacterium]